MKGRRAWVIGGGILLVLAYVWWRRRSQNTSAVAVQSLAQIPGGNVPIMSSGGGVSGNPTATTTAHPATQTTFSNLNRPVVHSPQGDIAGQPGENRWTASSASELMDKGGTWALHAGWQGPGTYEARKFTTPQGTTTEIVRIG